MLSSMDCRQAEMRIESNRCAGKCRPGPEARAVMTELAEETGTQRPVPGQESHHGGELRSSVLSAG